jgi:uncharacterized protein YndB with AHSA1/START domain
MNEQAIIEGSYRAKVEDLWDIWTTKQGIESWWGPEGFRAEVYTLEAKLGGILLYDMIADSAEMIEAMERMARPGSHEVRSTFTDFSPRKRLAITSMIDFIPGVEPYENTKLVEFFPDGETVKMVVTLEAKHDEELTKMSIVGFTSQLSKLDNRFN